MKVLGISGSPRRRSNTDLLLEAALKGATEAGAETQTLFAADLNVMACNHCDACLRSAGCPFLDDMPRVIQALKDSDRLILAAPLHFMGLPSQLKAVVDRTQAQWVRKYVRHLPPLEDSRERRGLFLGVGGRKGETLFNPVLVTVKAFFATLDIRFTGMLGFPSIDGRAAILDHPTALAEADAAGAELVKAPD